jgi:hypothetical protein
MNGEQRPLTLTARFTGPAHQILLHPVTDNC